MSRRRAEWTIALLSIVSAIVALLAGSLLLPFDQRPLILAAALMGLALYLTIGLYPGRRG